VYKAVPLLIATVPLSIGEPSLLKVTVPVASEGEGVAVNVTESPYVEGLSDEISVNVLVATLTAWLSAVEVAPLSFASPP
jgi:hypothetical protein